MAFKLFRLAVMARLPSFIMHVALLITGQQRVNFPLYVANGSIGAQPVQLSGTY
jgi:hypothetical protein